MRCSRRLVAVSFCNMLLNVIGFCLGFSLFRPPRAAFGARLAASSAGEFRARKETSPKVLKGLLGAFSFLHRRGLHAAGAELQIAGGLIEIEFVRSASARWEKVARQWLSDRRVLSQTTMGDFRSLD